ncbi:MAG: efflux RND transporter periplasmic adaptor subunit, partial [Alphaproteobacteria bacterium]|nr:efflux RND transporter periplasmic adaptor subunit [Alphaproteobacteria bacterium]
MRLKWITLAFTVVAAALGALWAAGKVDLEAIAAWNDLEKPASAAATLKPPTITVVRPITRAFTETLRINGSLVPREEILIAPQIEGQHVSELLVEAGDYVEKGQLLARLATENLDALVAQSDAAIQRANASIAQAQSGITQAEAQLKEADASFARAKPLLKSGYLSQSIFDQRQAAATTARAARMIAGHNLKVAESEKAQAIAQRRELLWRRSRTEILAPAAGLILSRSAKVGTIATAVGEPMFRIAEAGEIELEGEVTSDHLRRLKPGQRATIIAAGAPEVAGTVRLVYPRVDPETRLGSIRIFIGRNDQLRAGTFASGSIRTAESAGLAVPVNAVMR